MYPDKEADLLKAFSPAEPIFTVDPDYIKRARSLSKREDNPCGQALKALLVKADAALKQEPLTIVNKPILPASGDKHDYMSVGPYWWPDPDKPDGLPYIRRDGEVNPEVEKTDRPLLAKFISTVKTLGLAYGFTHREDYAAHAALLLRTWFMNPETRMNPNLLFGQAIPGICEGRGIGLIETAAFAREMLPAVSFLRDSKNWSQKDMEDLQAWFHAFLEWMLKHPYGVDEARHGNNHSSSYDVQVVTFALFVGQSDLARMILKGVGERRIAAQIEPDGQQPLELARTKALGYASMNLELLLELAEIGRQWGIDLANFESTDGRSMRRAFDWLYPYWMGDREWTLPQIQPFSGEPAFRCMRLAAYLYLNMDFEPVKAELACMNQKEKAQQIYNLLVPPFEGSGLHALRISEDVVIRDPQVLVDPEFLNGDPALLPDPEFLNGDPTLSEAEVAFFKENGYHLNPGGKEE
ncbi:MAG: alginate lyase family protein [Gemmatimonadetes bacterium]|nr:alginate lyase family protein [Gemmatimonadota bacterium]